MSKYKKAVLNALMLTYDSYIQSRFGHEDIYTSTCFDKDESGDTFLQVLTEKNDGVSFGYLQVTFKDQSADYIACATGNLFGDESTYLKLALLHSDPSLKIIQLLI